MYKRQLLGSKWYFRFEKRRYLINQPEQLPARLWSKLLDHSMAKVYDNLNGDRHKIIKEIPYILACVAWRDKKEVFVKGADGLPEINHLRITEKQADFQEANGIEALRAFCFFLTFNKRSSHNQNTKFYQSLLSTQTSKRPSGAKTMLKNGGG